MSHKNQPQDHEGGRESHILGGSECWVNMWSSALPRTPVPPHLDMQLIRELHRLEEVAGDDPFLQGEER